MKKEDKKRKMSNLEFLRWLFWFPVVTFLILTGEHRKADDIIEKHIHFFEYRTKEIKEAREK